MKAKNLLLMAVMAGLSLTSVHAKTIYYVKVNGTGNGTSWSDAAGNIQDMIDKAVAGDEVWVAAGTYFPTTKTTETVETSRTFLIIDGVNLYGGFAGNEKSIDDRAKSDMDGNGKVDAWEFSNETILSGKISDNVKSTCVVNYPNSFTTETLFDGFTVTEGSCGISVSIKETVSNCKIMNNSGYRAADSGIVSSATISGGGIYNSGDSNNCIIIVIWCATISGGGIYNSGGTINNCSITNNSVTLDDINGHLSYSKGGGIYNKGGWIINCTVKNNSCYTINGCSYAHYAEGGGIYNEIGWVINCVITNNSCNAKTSCYGTPSYGQAYNSLGGGVYNYYGSVNSCCVTNNLVYASTAHSVPIYQQGGGIYNCGSSSDKAYIYCSTIVKNSAYNATGPNPTDNLYDTTDYDFVYNCITDDADMTQFVNFSLNDFHLISGSKYIDAGSLDNLPDWVINGTDLAGNPRTHDGKISLGAYEYDPSYVSTGIHELQQQAGITVSPSPATDFITVSGLQGNETLRFYNINGQLLLTRKASGEMENVAVGNLPSGIYLLKVDNGQSLKWVKR